MEVTGAPPASGNMASGMWRLPDQTRSVVGDAIQSHHRGLAWCWVAMRSAANPQWQVVSVVARPIYPDVTEVHLVGANVAVVAQHMSSAEAAKRWSASIAGRLDATDPLNFNLLGERVDAFWVTGGETWGQGRRAGFPEYQAQWTIDGASNLVASGQLWEPLEDAHQHFPSAWAAIYPYLFGIPYNQRTNAYLNAAALIRLTYPVGIGDVSSSETAINVRIDEDAPRLAAGHSIHLHYRQTADQALPLTMDAPIMGPGDLPILIDGPAVNWALTLVSSNGIRRDFREWANAAPLSAVTVPTPQPLRKDRWRFPAADVPPEATTPVVVQEPVLAGGAVPADEVTPDFSRLADAENAELLAQRWNEAVISLKAGAGLAAITMMGSLLEGALLQMAMRHATEANRTQAAPKDGSKPKPWGRWRLADLINVAVQANWITVDLKDFGVLLRDYRNLVHPWESQAKAFHPTTASASICWEVTKQIVDQVIAHEGARPRRTGGSARKLTKLPKRPKLSSGPKSIVDYVRDQRR